MACGPTPSTVPTSWPAMTRTSSASSGRGQVLMPWPNRIRDGRYSFAGVDQQLAITEIPLSNSSHGLVRWLPWQLHWHDEGWSALTVRTRLHPSPGLERHPRPQRQLCPRRRRSVRHRARRQRGGCTRALRVWRAPVRRGDDTRLADVELAVPAAREVRVDERMIPTTTDPVRPETTSARARPLGSTSLDTAYTDLVRTRHGRGVGGHRRRARGRRRPGLG